MVCGDRGVSPDPRIFEAWTDARYDGFDDAEGRIPGVRECAPVLLRDIACVASAPAIPGRVASPRCPLVFGRKSVGSPPRFGGLNSWVSGC